MPIWEIKNGGYVRFQKINTNYFSITEQDENNLKDYIEENFGIDITNIFEILVIDEYAYTNLTIKLKSNKNLTFKYNENKLPDVFKFYKYDKHEINKPDNEDDIKLKIHTASTY